MCTFGRLLWSCVSWKSCGTVCVSSQLHSMLPFSNMQCVCKHETIFNTNHFFPAVMMCQSLGREMLKKVFHSSWQVTHGLVKLDT